MRGQHISVLHSAILQNKVSKVELLLRNGYDSNLCKEEYAPPLHFASSRGANIQIIKLLLAHGADVNARTVRGETAVEAAARAGFAPICRLLLQKGASVPRLSVLLQSLWPVKKSCAEVLRLLLEYGADPNEQWPSRSPRCMLMYAVIRNEYKVVQILIDANVNLDQKHQCSRCCGREITALQVAVSTGSIGCAFKLLQAGANAEGVEEMQATFIRATLNTRAWNAIVRDVRWQRRKAVLSIQQPFKDKVGGEGIFRHIVKYI